MRFLDVTLDTCQDTSGYMYSIFDASSRYIRIHRDTKSRYMYLGRVMTTLQDTIRIHHDTCILDASSEPRWIHKRYARNTLRIHSGNWPRSICPAAQGAEVAPPLRRWSRAPLGARAEGLAPVPSDCSLHEPRLLLQGIRLNRTRLKVHLNAVLGLLKS